MAPLGTAWHLPSNVESAAGIPMRDPVFPTKQTGPVRIFSGNYDREANQWQQGSSVFYKRAQDPTWKSVDLRFSTDIEKQGNKYFVAEIPLAGFEAFDQVLYYLVIAYETGVRDTTYLGVAPNEPSTGWFSRPLASPAEAQASPFTFTIGVENPEKRQYPRNQQKPFVYPYLRGDRTTRGEWSPVFSLPNVSAHASLLPTGKVLMWGRRDDPTQSMNSYNPDTPNRVLDKAATCTPFILDLDSLTCKFTGQPFTADKCGFNTSLPKTADNKNTNANLFCSGHAFLADGKLFVAGGHLYDSHGLDQACTYDAQNDLWEAVQVPRKGGDTVMGRGRWYPTVVALPNGAALVASGTDEKGIYVGAQISSTSTTGFVDIQPATEPFDLYPLMHVASSGLVYWISKTDKTMRLDLADPKRWNSVTVTGIRRPPTRDYAPSVMYETDKVVYMGGGNAPIPTTEILNLTGRDTIDIQRSEEMLFSRRQHNATVLPDGTVLVTGGTRGNGPGFRQDGNPIDRDVTFNDLRPGQPVHVPELWTPPKGGNKGTWTPMAAEQVDRSYHAVALLLPDARVLSAGGGEFQLGENTKRPNPQWDSHHNAQIFSPAYLFKGGTRPNIENVSKATIECSATSKFEVTAASAEKIDKVSLVGLGSVTHSLNFSQRLMFLTFTQNGRKLMVDAPKDIYTCPPGFYMLFIVNSNGVPSKASFVKIVPTAEAKAMNISSIKSLAAMGIEPQMPLEARRVTREAATGTRIELGINAICPYGLSACWANAHDALSRLDGVEHVDPLPHRSGSTASVFLSDNSLPDLDLWTSSFKELVRDTYHLRGYEAAVIGTVEARDEGVVLIADGTGSEAFLVPLEPESKVQWDMSAGRPHLVTKDEAMAYNSVLQLVSSGNTGLVTITGPLSVTENGHTIQVRKVT